MNAQTKFEKEYRIKETEVHEKAVAFIDNCFDNKTRIKWYAEESQDGKSIEAKTFYNNHCFSVEFDNTGAILDVEKKVKFKNIEKNLRDHLIRNLGLIFKKYKILKTQIQWKASNETLISLINGRSPNHSYETFYELVLKGQKEGEFGMFEILFDSKGKQIEILEIIQRNTDNLQF